MSNPKRADFLDLSIFDKVTRLSDLRVERVEWLVEDIIPAGALVLIAGSFGSYKSWVARDIAAAIDDGTHWAGFNVPTRRPVLYLDRENSSSQIARLRDAMRVEPSEGFVYWGSWVRVQRAEDGPIVRPGPALPEVLEWSRENRGLIVFDTLSRFHDQKENDNSAMTRVMELFIDLARAGSAVILLHHKGKSKEAQFRGAEDIAGAVDIAYTAERNETAPNLVTLNQIKNRFAVEQKIEVALIDGRFRRAEYEEEWG